MSQGQGSTRLSLDRRQVLFVSLMALGLWIVNVLWLERDTRPPVWDMALHQSYALNYLPGWLPDAGPSWERSGNYPPFVHLVIAFCFFLFRPSPDTAALANIPATVLLLWSIFELGRELAGPATARWACFLTAVIPYMMWMSRETVLDYWLSAWFALFLVVLRRTRGFESHGAAVLLGIVMALGLLTKWFFPGFALLPLAYVCVRARVWESAARLLHLVDALLVAAIAAGIWYLPNIPNLMRYFSANMQIGAREGEPAVFSFQSLIYYLRLLEGYQLLGILSGLLVLSAVFVWRKRLLNDGPFLVVAIVGGWISMTLLRTKDPRFTMPILGLLAIVCGAWMQSWKSGWRAAAARGALVIALGAQGYAINFGISWLPRQVVLAEGYQGSLRWDWNFFLQHYFHILGPPRQEDWKQAAVLRRMAEHGRENRVELSLALVPDLPRFDAANFQLEARLERVQARVDHLQSAARGIHSFDDFNYAVMTEADQGMPWTTLASRGLNQIIVDHPEVFRLLDTYPLPNGDSARLYYIQHEEGAKR